MRLLRSFWFKTDLTEPLLSQELEKLYIEAFTTGQKSHYTPDHPLPLIIPPPTIKSKMCATTLKSHQLYSGVIHSRKCQKKLGRILQTGKAQIDGLAEWWADTRICPRIFLGRKKEKRG